MTPVYRAWSPANRPRHEECADLNANPPVAPCLCASTRLPSTGNAAKGDRSEHPYQPRVFIPERNTRICRLHAYPRRVRGRARPRSAGAARAVKQRASIDKPNLPVYDQRRCLPERCGTPSGSGRADFRSIALWKVALLSWKARVQLSTRAQSAMSRSPTARSRGCAYGTLCMMTGIARRSHSR